MERRSEIIKSRITPSMREQLELDLREQSNVLSLSDWIFEAIEERLERRGIRLPNRSVVSRTVTK